MDYARESRCFFYVSKSYYSTVANKPPVVLDSPVKLNVPDIFKTSDSFLDWFVGLSDGEGCFYMAEKRNLNSQKVRFSFYFKIALHIDDRKVLEYIHKTLNLGNVSINSKGDEFKFVVSKTEELIKIIAIFDKHTLNTSKYLNYMDWRKAFLLYNNRDQLNDELVSEILKIKNQMNNSRTNYIFPAEHQIRITSYWLLGFVEGEGSFNVSRKKMEPAFVVALNDKEFPVIRKIREFLLENLRFDAPLAHQNGK